MSVDRKLKNVTFSKIYPKIQVYCPMPLTSYDQKHSLLLVNTFQPFNIRLKLICNRYERFWTQQSLFQNYVKIANFVEIKEKHRRLPSLGCRFTFYSLFMDIQNSFLDIHN